MTMKLRKNLETPNIKTRTVSLKTMSMKLPSSKKFFQGAFLGIGNAKGWISELLYGLV